MAASRQRALLSEAEALQELLVDYSTGGGDEADLDVYRAGRKALTADPRTKALVPQCVRECRDLGQFWQFIKSSFPTYAERRQFLWKEFRPLLDALEDTSGSPAEPAIADVLKSFDTGAVHEIWTRALERSEQDAEGAITLPARC